MKHQINIHTSEKNKEVVRFLTSKLPYGTKENVIARIALSYSIQKGKKFSKSEYNKYDSKGKEYKDHILFDPEFRDFYIALVSQHYGIPNNDNIIPKLIKLHIDDGLERINNFFENNPDYTFIEFLAPILEEGISFLENSDNIFGPVKNYNQKIEKEFFTSNIDIDLGKDVESNNDIIFHWNNINLYNNQHIAVAGSSGTGKTQFALDILFQIFKESNGIVNFIYLDFKGLKDKDVKKMSYFFENTNTEFIDVPHKPFPINPLSFIDNINEKNKLMGINKFVDIISKYQNIGKKQKIILKEATKEAFIDKSSGEYPSIKDIYNKLIEQYGDKKDILIEIMQNLSDFEIFDNNITSGFFNKNVYLSLSGDLPDSVRFTSLFLIVNYIYNTFMNMEDAPVFDNIQAMRYVMLIDEAHVIFKEKKYQEILERILREIRSKGVSVILLSQGIEEFIQPSFDFSSMCNTGILLNINNKDYRIIKRFLGFSDAEMEKARDSFEKINRGYAITNINEPEYTKGSLFKIRQFWERIQNSYFSS